MHFSCRRGGVSALVFLFFDGSASNNVVLIFIDNIFAWSFLKKIFVLGHGFDDVGIGRPMTTVMLSFS